MANVEGSTELLANNWHAYLTLALQIRDAMPKNITTEDEGKPVVDARDDQIGVVAEVEGDTAWIEFDPGLTDEVKNRLGFGDTSGQDTNPIDEEQIDAVGDDKVILKN